MSHHPSAKEYPACSVAREFQIVSMITIFRRIYHSHYYYKGESHNFWEIICVLDGIVRIAVEDKIFELQKNQLLFLKPMEFHNMCSINHTNPDVLIMSFQLEGRLPLNQPIVTIDTTSREELLQLYALSGKIFHFDEIQVRSVRSNLSSGVHVFVNRLELLLLYILEQKALPDTQLKTVCTGNYSKIMEILKNNLHKNLSIKEIAMLAGMSQSNVKKTFSMFTNRGIMHYFQELKMEEAKKLLLNGHSVYEVSQLLGYTEQSYFSMTFKKSTGASPRNWLKLIKEK